MVDVMAIPLKSWLRPLSMLASMLACVAAVSACTPPPDARVAATVRDGEVLIIGYVCKGYQVSILQLYEKDVAEDGASWVVAPPVDQNDYADSAHTIYVRPFEAPEGWETLDDSLPRLESTTRYDVAFGTVQGQDSVITFTVEQLQQLDGHHVWAGRTGSERVMREDRFIRRAARDCPT
jgi:hypothetical protein